MTLGQIGFQGARSGAEGGGGADTTTTTNNNNNDHNNDDDNDNNNDIDKDNHNDRFSLRDCKSRDRVKKGTCFRTRTAVLMVPVEGLSLPLAARKSVLSLTASRREVKAGFPSSPTSP